MKINQNSRRDFIATTLVAGATLAGCATKNPFTAEAIPDVKPSGEMVKLLSVDGEIIEVDKAFLKPVPEMPTGSLGAQCCSWSGTKFADCSNAYGFWGLAISLLLGT